MSISPEAQEAGTYATICPRCKITAARAMGPIGKTGVRLDDWGYKCEGCGNLFSGPKPDAKVSSEAREVIHEQQKQRELYSVEELQKVLFSLGYEVPRNTLYLAMKWTGWLKLRLVRERLLEVKREIPKRYPFDGLRSLVKWPLLADREEDLG